MEDEKELSMRSSIRKMQREEGLEGREGGDVTHTDPTTFPSLPGSGPAQENKYYHNETLSKTKRV